MVTRRFFETMALRIERDDPTDPHVRVQVDDRHLNVNGVVHGSVLHALLDTAMGLVAFRHNDRQPVATAEMSVRFLRPAREGVLEARAAVVSSGKRLLVLDGRVTRAGELVALGQATFVPIRTD